jgi:hypothetical protein
VGKSSTEAARIKKRPTSEWLAGLKTAGFTANQETFSLVVCPTVTATFSW